MALLAAFATWSALAVIWSATPDASWIEANRATSYALVAGLALVAGASLRNAPALAATGLSVVILAVALYALAGKTIPWFEFAGLDLDPGSALTRLREPIGYWNALGLLCVMATPAAIWLCASPSPQPPVRVGAACALVVLLLAAGLTYSRGSVIAFAAALAVMVAAGPQRLPRFAVGLGAVAAALPALVFAFGRDDLSTAGVSVSGRTDGGLILLGLILLTLAAVATGTRALLGREAQLRRNWTPRHSRGAWRALAAAAIAVLVLAAAAVTVAGRGVPGEISHQVDRFQEVKGAGAAPARLISATGSNRWVWWTEAAGAFGDKPIAGWGPGSFPVVRNLYRTNPAPTNSVHSVPLQFLMEGGLIGAGLAGGGLLLLGGAAIRRTRESTGVERSARLALLAAACAWGVHSLYDWNWQIPAVTLPALLALGVAAVPPARRARPPRRNLARSPLAAAASVLAAVVAISSLLPAIADSERLDAAVAAAGGSLRSAAEQAELARRLDPLSIEPLLTGAVIAAGAGRTEEALGYLEEAGELEPDNARIWFLISALELIRPAGGSGEALRRLAATNPLVIAPQAATVGALAFAADAPPAASPTAAGTPPP